MTVLLLCPSAYSYEKIIASIQKQGHDVIYFEDGIKTNFVLKLCSKILGKSFYNKYFSIHRNKICKKARKCKIDKVLLIFGALYINKDHIKSLKQIIPNAQFVYYAWDSFSNFPNPLKYISEFDKAYSFDQRDCANYGLIFRPLFYSTNFIENEVEYDVSSVMTMSPKKLSQFKHVMSILPFGLSKNINLYFGNYFKILILKLKKYFIDNNIDTNFVCSKKIPFETSMKIFSKSKAIIDVPLKGQNGLTQRTFDALYLQKKLITSNANIMKYEFYTPDNIFVVSSDDKEIPNEFFSTPFNKDYCLNEKYSCENWVKDLLDF